MQNQGDNVPFTFHACLLVRNDCFVVASRIFTLTRPPRFLDLWCVCALLSMCTRFPPFSRSEIVEAQSPVLSLFNHTHTAHNCLIYCCFACTLIRHIPCRSKSYLSCPCWCAKSELVFSVACLHVSLSTPTSVRYLRRIILHFCMFF